jgi:uncharacterized membrane protein YcaP (DUF421 family)
MKQVGKDVVDMLSIDMYWLNNILGLNATELEWHQMVLRAIVVYFVALTYIRVAGMRSISNSSAFDVVITITMGGVLSRAISGHYPFFPTLITAFAMAVCHRIIALISFKFDFARKLVEGKPVLLFNEGLFLEKNLSLHSIHRADLDRTLREQGIDDYTKVKSIWYEVDGKISVVKR